MKTRVLRRGSVKGAYSPSSNHPFYGWHRFLVGSRRKRRCRFQHLSAAGPGKVGSCLGAWCSSTKEQGFAGREAPRRADGRPVRAWGRGARRRRNKGLRGVKHHAGANRGPVRPIECVAVPAPRRSAAGWHQKAELLPQLRDIIILSDENRDLISENPSRIGLVWKIHEGVLLGIMRNGSI